MTTARTHTGRRFFGVVALLATPLWLLNLILPDVNGLPKDIPPTDLALAFVPMTAAIILIGRESGLAEVKRMFTRVLDAGRIPKPMLPMVLGFMPLLYLLTYLAALLFGKSILVHHAPPPATLPLNLILFFALAIGEELGYLGYLWDDWERRFTALGASLLFSVPWMGLHIPSILQQGKSWGYIAISFITMAGTRIVWTWLWTNSGRSFFAMIAIHTTTNLMATYLVQEYSTYALVLTSIVAAVWWGRDLNRRRFANRPRHGAMETTSVPD